MKESNEGEENIKERKAQTCPSPAIEESMERKRRETSGTCKYRSVSKDLSPKSNNS
jgi:hypothetical protein